MQQQKATANATVKANTNESINRLGEKFSRTCPSLANQKKNVVAKKSQQKIAEA